MEESAPTQVQSDVTCQPEAIDIEGAVVSLFVQNVTATVSTPAVASAATGSPFIVAGEMSAVASNSQVCNASEVLSEYVKAPNVKACLAGESEMLSIAYVHTAYDALGSI